MPRFFGHVAHASLCALSMLALPGCERSVTPHTPDASMEALPCEWRDVSSVVTLPEDTEVSRLVATAKEDGTATVLAPVETSEAGYGFYLIRVGPDLAPRAQVFVPDYFPRAVRDDGATLAMVALENPDADCVYLELDTAGHVTRRETLLVADIAGCAYDLFAIDATHVVRIARTPPPDFTSTLERYRRSDMHHESLDAATTGGSVSHVTPAITGSFYVSAYGASGLELRELGLADAPLLSFETPWSEHEVVDNVRSSSHGDFFYSRFPRVVEDEDDRNVTVTFASGSVRREITVDSFASVPIFAASTDTKVSLVFPSLTAEGNIGLWTYDRRDGTASLKLLEGEGLGWFPSTKIAVASASHHAFVFWNLGGVITGTSMTCL